MSREGAARRLRHNVNRDVGRGSSDDRTSSVDSGAERVARVGRKTVPLERPVRSMDDENKSSARLD